MEVNYDKVRCVKHNNIDYLKDYQINSLMESYKFDMYDYYFYNINNEIYHIKKKGYIREILGNLVSKYYGLDCLESEMIQLENRYIYLITKNFIKEGHKYTNLNSGIFPHFNYNYYSGKSSILELDNLNRIRSNNTSKVVDTEKKDLMKLKTDLKKMIILDYMTNQSDRAFRNFMIEYKDNNVKLMPLYDFDFSFDQTNICNNAFDIDYLNNKELEYIKQDEVFQILLYKSMDLNMKDILDELMSKYPIILNKDEIEVYLNVIQDKKEEIKKYKLIR